MKKSAAHLSPRDPKVRRAIGQARKAFEKYAQEQARRLQAHRSKNEQAILRKLSEVVQIAVPPKTKLPKLPSKARFKFPFKPYFTPAPVSATFPSTWFSF